MTREMWKGNEAIAEAAVRHGLEAYFGYPITPQTEILEYLSGRMVSLGRVFLQAESEVASVNMVYGAAAAGARVMSSTSSPGVSLMQEGLSYIACSEIPAVLINVMRAGPGLGNISPAQGDYWQATKMAGHGDFHPLVLAPGTVQEAIDCVGLAFDLSDKYRTLAQVLLDGNVGQLMEPAEMPPMKPLRKPEERDDYALTGAAGRPRRIVNSLYLDIPTFDRVNRRLQAKLREIERNEVRWREFQAADADLLLVGFGSVGRTCQSVVKLARQQGLRVGLLRPITVWPFPSARLAELAQQVRGMLVVEMNAGQMYEDVRLAVEGRCPVTFKGWMGGVAPLVEDIFEPLLELDRQTRS